MITEADVSWAANLAKVRPLGPFPGWKFGSVWQPGGIDLRMDVVERFRKALTAAPVTVNWYNGTRIRLNLQNELGAQIFLGGCYEPNEMAFVDQFLKPGMTFLDAGAHEGLYTVLARSRVGLEGRIYAFEPSIRECRALLANLELNRMGADLWRAALGSQEAVSELKVARPPHSGHNTLGSFVYSATQEVSREAVPEFPLDLLVSGGQDQPAAITSRIDLIKVDIEGAEAKFLLGARTTLKRFRPWLLIELSEHSLNRQGSTRQAVVDLLKEFGYGLYGFSEETGLPTDRYQIGAAACDNVVAIPS